MGYVANCATVRRDVKEEVKTRKGEMVFSAFLFMSVMCRNWPELRFDGRRLRRAQPRHASAARVNCPDPPNPTGKLINKSFSHHDHPSIEMSDGCTVLDWVSLTCTQRSPLWRWFASRYGRSSSTTTRFQACLGNTSCPYSTNWAPFIYVELWMPVNLFQRRGTFHWPAESTWWSDDR